MSTIACFMLERTDLARQSLRRYRGSDDGGACPGRYGYHNADVVIAESVPFDSEWEGDSTRTFSHDDPRWPKACPCGYLFQDGDRWQHNLTRLHRCPDGRLVTHRDSPAGAMWFGDWPGYEDMRGPDGHSLYVMLPDGHDWCVDGTASGGGKWTRTGVPPNVTATPSILTSGYHGFLTDGQLVSC